MNFGYIEDAAGITKAIRLNDIKIINTTSDSITVRYNNSNSPTQISDREAFFIVFNNPSNVSTSQIESQFYSWLKNALISDKGTLNSAMPQLEIISAGLINSPGYREGTFSAQADETAACAASNTLACVVESRVGTPPVGALVLANPSDNDYAPIADGTYSITLDGFNHFVSLSKSRILSATRCPFTLDYVFNLQNLGAGPVTSSSLDGLGFAWNLSTQDRSTLFNLYNISGNPITNQNPLDACSTSNTQQRRMYGTDNGYWPIGIINNGNLDFSSFDVTFGIKLADSNVADWDDAEIYISFDFNANGEVVADSTFTPFALTRGFNILGSPTGGIPGLGDGTLSVVANSQQGDDTLYNMFGASRFFIPPAGQSALGTANFSDGAYVVYNRSTGLIVDVDVSACNPVT